MLISAPLFYARFIFITLLFFIMTATMSQTHAQALSPVVDFSLYNAQFYKNKEKHGAVEVRVLGEKEQRVFLFVPNNPAPDNEVPVVFFHHGWQGMNPMNFGALIDHLVRSGHVVIYPVFQDGDKTSPLDLTYYAGHANRMALNLLAQEFGLTPKQGQTLYYGFSIGAAISVNLALASHDYGLPPPDALVLIAPGDAFHIDLPQKLESIYGPVESLSPSLPVVIMTGEEDTIGMPTAKTLYAKLKQTSTENRILYILPPSEHAGRKVAAGHGSPGAPDSRYNFSPHQQRFPRTLAGKADYEKSASLNQLDFWGYWKIIDGVLEGLKNNGNFSPLVFGDGLPEQLSLGTWEDGAPLTPMKLQDISAH